MRLEPAEQQYSRTIEFLTRFAHTSMYGVAKSKACVACGRRLDNTARTTKKLTFFEAPVHPLPAMGGDVEVEFVELDLLSQRFVQRVYSSWREEFLANYDGGPDSGVAHSRREPADCKTCEYHGIFSSTSTMSS